MNDQSLFAEENEPQSCDSSADSQPTTGTPSQPEGKPFSEILYDLSFEDYQAIRALNQSTLKLCGEENGGSPKHAKAAFDGLLKRSDSEALRLGRAEHCWITEGEDVFRERFTVARPCEALLKSGDRKGDECGKASSICVDGTWLCKTHAPAGAESATDYISPGDLERIKGMSEAVRAHKINGQLKRPGWSECTIVYDVPVKASFVKDRDAEQLETVHIDTALRHKVRIDRLAGPTKTRPHLIVDLKRTQVMEITRGDLERKIERYGWDVQAAMYTEAVRIAFGVEQCDFIWIFVEEGPPHDVVWIPLSGDTLAVGRDKLKRYRLEWAKAEATGVWPGICNGEQPAGGLSDWAIKDYRKRFGDDMGHLQGDGE